MHWNNKCKVTNGFTLLELLVVLSVIGVLTLFTAPYLQNWNIKNSYNNSLSSISGVLSNARIESLQRLTTVKVTTTKSNNSYNLKTYYSQSAVSDCAANTTWNLLTNETISINSAFTISGSGIGDICFFKDGTSTGGAFAIRQKDGSSNIASADISVVIATGFVDVVE
jgi:prepilin-type N-terminal cleavage/methylation domain-containing protein